MRIRERAKWLWSRISDFFTAQDILSWLTSISAIQSVTALLAGGLVLLGGLIEKLPLTITAVAALFAATLVLVIVNYLAALFSRQESPATEAFPPVAPRGWIGRAKWPTVLALGVATLGLFSWQQLQTPPKPTVPQFKAAEKSTVPQESASTEGPARSGRSVEVVEAAPPPRIIYVPAPGPPSPVPAKPKTGAADTPPSESKAETEESKPATQASQPTPEEIAKARQRSIVNFMRLRRDRGDALFLALRETLFEGATLDLVEDVEEWDRVNADYVGDYSGAEARQAYLAANSVNEKKYLPNKLLPAELAAKRVAMMNLIRSRQLILGELYTTNIALPVATSAKLPAAQAPSTTQP